MSIVMDRSERGAPAALAAGASILLIAFVSLMTAQSAGARTLSGVEMPDSVRIERRLLRLNGMAPYRRFGFPVLVAGLYLTNLEGDPTRILASDSPRRYVTHFLRNVSAKRICDAWRKGLDDNTPNASEEVRAQFRTLCHWLRDFHSGDEITATYLPTTGCRIEISGTQMGVIKGKGFADAYFGLALGPKPGPGDRFKRRLLGE